jgi:hypothetical protein
VSVLEAYQEACEPEGVEPDYRFILVWLNIRGRRKVVYSTQYDDRSYKVDKWHYKGSDDEVTISLLT